MKWVNLVLFAIGCSIVYMLICIHAIAGRLDEYRAMQVGISKEHLRSFMGEPRNVGAKTPEGYHTLFYPSTAYRSSDIAYVIDKNDIVYAVLFPESFTEDRVKYKSWRISK